MNPFLPVFKREFLGYFRTPVAYVFLAVFSLASLVLALFVSQFFKSGSASLDSYFTWQIWLFLLFAPAAGMRLWSEEKKSGTMELLFTMPVTPLQAVLAKFTAAWAFLVCGLLLSFPLVVTTAWLGDPDWGIMISGYVGCILMAGAYLAVSSLMSALTKNQVIAFVLGLFVNLILVFLGASVFSGILESFLPQAVADVIANFSPMTHLDPFMKGIIDLKDVVFFLSLGGFSLFLNVLALER